MLDAQTVLLLVESLLEKGYVDATKEILKLANIDQEQTGGKK